MHSQIALQMRWTEVSSDWLYFIEVALRGRTIYLPQSLARYRRHAENATRLSVSACEETVYDIVDSSYPDYRNAGVLGRVRLHGIYSFKYLLSGEPRLALEQVRRLFRIWRKTLRPRRSCLVC